MTVLLVTTSFDMGDQGAASLGCLAHDQNARLYLFRQDFVHCAGTKMMHATTDKLGF